MSQRSRAQFRANSGAPFAVNSEETEVENSGTRASGKVQASAAGARGKSRFCDEAETGAAGTGCDSGEAGAVQHALLQ
jgi:hypothetical protein